MKGRPPQPDVLQLPLTLTLRSGAITVTYPLQTTDASGYFTVPVGRLANGNYTWRVKGPTYLANAGLVTFAGNPVTNTEMGRQRAGDCNNDNHVSITDFVILSLTFGKQPTDPGYDDRADYTGDQRITIEDFMALRANFGILGAP